MSLCRCSTAPDDPQQVECTSTGSVRVLTLQKGSRSRVLARGFSPLEAGNLERLSAPALQPTVAEVILQGIAEGFRIGYDVKRCLLKEKAHDMLSALEYPEVVSIYVEETTAGRFICVGSPETAQNMGIHVSPFPKKNRPNKWRLIVNLSAPDAWRSSLVWRRSADPGALLRE